MGDLSGGILTKQVVILLIYRNNYRIRTARIITEIIYCITSSKSLQIKFTEFLIGPVRLCDGLNHPKMGRSFASH